MKTHIFDRCFMDLFFICSIFVAGEMFEDFMETR